MAFSCVSLSPRLSKSEKELPACLPLTPYIYLLFSRMCNFCKTLSVSPSISLGGLCVRGTIRALEVLDFVRILIATAGRRVCTPVHAQYSADTHTHANMTTGTQTCIHANTLAHTNRFAFMHAHTHTHKQIHTCNPYQTLLHTQHPNSQTPPMAAAHTAHKKIVPTTPTSHTHTPPHPTPPHLTPTRTHPITPHPKTRPQNLSVPNSQLT